MEIKNATPHQVSLPRASCHGKKKFKSIRAMHCGHCNLAVPVDAEKTVLDAT